MQDIVLMHSAIMEDDSDNDVQCVNVFVDSVLSSLFGIRGWYLEQPGFQRKVNQD